MQLIIFVHTCTDHEETRAKKIEETWADNSVVFITDNPNSTLRNHFYISEYNREISYHHKNIIKMFNLFIEKYSNYDWFMIIDDDSYLYIDKLKQFLEFQNKDECLEIGDYLNWTEFFGEKCNYSMWVAGGCGIVFTKKCILAYLRLSSYYQDSDTNHYKWLHNLWMFDDTKSIKRIHCCGFHKYVVCDLDISTLQSMNKMMYISIHLNDNINLFSKFHSLRNIR